MKTKTLGLIAAAALAGGCTTPPNTLKFSLEMQAKLPGISQAVAWCFPKKSETIADSAKTDIADSAIADSAKKTADPLAEPANQL